MDIYIYMVCPSQLQSFMKFCWAVYRSCADKKNRTDGYTYILTDGRVKYIISYATCCMWYNNIPSPSPKTALYQVWLKMAQWFWRIRFLNLNKWRSALSLVSSLRKGRGPSFEQTWIPSTLGCSVPSLVEISQVLLEKKIALFRYHILFGKGGALHLNLRHPMILCAKFAWNWPCVSGEDFLYSFSLSSFVIISPCKCVWSFDWRNLISLYTRMLCA